MTQERINDILSMMVDNLVSVSRIEDFDAVYDTNDYRISSVRICSLIYDAVAKSDFKDFRGVPYFFTGYIYEPVTDVMRDRAVELYLLRMRVRSTDMYYSKKKFFEEAKRSVSLNGKLHPVFHIKAYRNGVMDFEKGEFSDFSSKFHVTYIHDYKYDPAARCPTWMNFLKSVLPEKESRLILQMFLGLCTMNRGEMGSKVENCLMLYGNGSNGKGVIFDTVRGLFGRHNVSTMSLMSMVKGGDERQRNLAAIDGKLVNFCPEIHARDMSGYEDAFKSLCSGEPQYGRSIGKNVHTIVNVPWLIFSMNSIPKASDVSYGYFRRYLYVVFNYIVPEDMQNKHLAQDLKSEYSGILNWVYRGAKYLKQRRYQFPKSETSEKQKLVVMAQADVVASWADARGIRYCDSVKGEISCWIKASMLYDDMVKYAEMNGFECNITKKGFSSAMGKLGFGPLNRVRTSESIKYKVYGCTEEELKTPPPVINDFNLGADDMYGVEYDEDDL